MRYHNTIQPALVKRDEDGYWAHPLVPDFNEDDRAYRQWLIDSNLIVRSTWLSNQREHPAHDRYFEEGETNIADWDPPKPAGDHWFLLWIGPTEDDVSATWAKHGVSAPLVFRGANDLPNADEYDMAVTDEFILWNQCSGFDIAHQIVFDSDGKFLHFANFMGNVTFPPDAFNAWAPMITMQTEEYQSLTRLFKKLPPGETPR